VCRFFSPFPIGKKKKWHFPPSFVSLVAVSLVAVSLVAVSLVAVSLVAVSLVAVSLVALLTPSVEHTMG
jgi:hypothetical protein